MFIVQVAIFFWQIWAFVLVCIFVGTPTRERDVGIPFFPQNGLKSKATSNLAQLAH